MHDRQQPETDLAQVAHPQQVEGLKGAASGQERKYWIALALYAILAALAWFTLDEAKVLVAGRPVDLRLLPLIILGGLALRTVLARQAEKIRRGGRRSS